MHPRTNKKMLQDNCQRLRSQIQQLQQRLRSSSLSKISKPSVADHKRTHTKLRQATAIDQQKQLIKEQYDRALEELDREFSERREQLKKDFERRLEQVERQQSRQHSKTIMNVPRPLSRPNKENALNTTNISYGRKEDSRVRMYDSMKKEVKDFVNKTPVPKSILTKSKFGNKIDYDSSDSEEENRTPLVQCNRKVKNKYY